MKKLTSTIIFVSILASTFCAPFFGNGFSHFQIPRAEAINEANSTYGLSQESKDVLKEGEEAKKATAPDTDPEMLPACGFDAGVVQVGNSNGTFVGCIAQAFYYVLFVPTSYIFALSGMFFDFTFAYSIDDGSYKTPFITQGWALIRDMVNMFFIFVLLFVAFKTILNVAHGKTKELVMNVVIIGILINFSLFAAQVIVDTSNILARVFYNDDAIKITKGGERGGSALYDKGANGEVQLSAALVNKINPQNLISQASKVNDMSTVGNADSASDLSSDGVRTLTAGTFILVTILASIVNIVGIFTFLSVGLIFVARVIGLWFAMILAPLAFFTYTVPSLQNEKIFGWKSWWSDLFRLSFLAPIFIFFMYLILRFLESGMNFIGLDNLTGAEWVIAIIIPFIFIMIMLLQAKNIAKDYAGTIGQTITNYVAAAGGFALAVGTGGAAMIGRGMGGMAARASAGETLTQRFADPTKRGTMKWYQKAAGWSGNKLGMNKVFGKTVVGGRATTGVGGILNRSQEKVNKVDHARHTVDEAKEKAGLKDVAWSRLSAIQREKVLTEFKKTNKDKLTTVAEEKIKSGLAFDTSGNPIQGFSDYKADRHLDEEQAYRVAKGITGMTPLTAPQQDELNKRKLALDKKINSDYENTILKPNINLQVSVEAEKEFEHEKEESNKQVSGFTRATSQANTGSWNVSNLSQLKQDKREGVFTKAATVSTALLSGQLRNAIGAIGFKYGKGATGEEKYTNQSKFIDDLKNGIAEAFKTANINVTVNTGGSGGEKKKDDHGGGGHH